jgi:acetyl-CoA acetyltransferase
MRRGQYVLPERTYLSRGERNAKRGLATLCIGGGMGIAMCVERD